METSDHRVSDLKISAIAPMIALTLSGFFIPALVAAFIVAFPIQIGLSDRVTGKWRIKWATSLFIFAELIIFFGDQRCSFICLDLSFIPRMIAMGAFISMSAFYMLARSVTRWPSLLYSVFASLIVFISGGVVAWAYYGYFILF